jgi:RecB family endonuclease NucS
LGRDPGALKHWVLKHPEAIGLPRKAEGTAEYPFPCGDRVDILFHMPDGTDAVVEIETSDPYPGCFQAVKYRALRLCERGHPLDSDRVRGIVVAWELDDSSRGFCESYDLQWVEKGL